MQDRTSGKYRINASDKNRVKDHVSPAYYRRAMRKVRQLVLRLMEQVIGDLGSRLRIECLLNTRLMPLRFESLLLVNAARVRV